jgi:hypothetical protein
VSVAFIPTGIMVPINNVQKKIPIIFFNFVASLMIIIMHILFKNLMVAAFVTLLLADYDVDG